MSRAHKLLGLAALVVAALLVWRCRGGDSSAPESHDGSDVARTTERNPRHRARAPIASSKRGSIRGRVTAGGQPVAGGRVCGLVDSDELSSVEQALPRCATTGADGRYAIVDLFRGDYTVRVSAAGYRGSYKPDFDRGDVPLTLAEGATLDGVDFELRGGVVEISGVVRDIGGGPVAGAWVDVSGRARASFLTQTGDDGRFSGWVVPGQISVSARAEGYTRGSTHGIAPGQTLEILLTPESVIAGIVVDVKSREPVPGTTVKAGDHSAITDDRGAFRIAGLDPGRYKPRATAVGRVGEVAESVLLGLGQTVEGVVVEVHPAFVVTGTLTAGGEPCRRGHVGIRETGRDEQTWEKVRSGRVEFTSVLPGSYQIDARCDDVPRGENIAALEVTDADVLDQVWTLETEGAGLAGRVVDKAGEPIEGAWVRVESDGGDPRAQRNWGWELTDESGHYAHEGLFPGAVKVTATADNHLDIDPLPATLVAGKTTRLDIELDGGGVIEGVVRDERGRPVAAVGVNARDTQRWGTRSQTLDDGTFRIEGVRPGEVRVTAARRWRALRAPGKGDDDVQGAVTRVTSGEVSRVELVVESQDGEIHGRVIDSAGEPVTDAFLSAERQSERTGALASNARRSSRWGWNRKPALTDTDGRFTIGELSPGEYTVRAYRKGGGEGFVSDVRLGSSATIRIVDSGSIAGTVALAGGGAPERFRVDVYDRDSGFRRVEGFFRTGGAWVMRDLPAGRYTVSATAAEGTGKTEAAITDGQARTGVALTLEARASVSGRLVSMDDGSPVSGLYVYTSLVKGSGSSSWRANDRKNISDADGRFEIQDAPAGRALLNVWPMDWEDAEFGQVSTVVTLEAGDTEDVGDIEVPRNRIKPKERGGDIGFTLAEQPRDTDPDRRALEVALVRPDGPAANTGLVAGDVITSVDGRDVTGVKYVLFRTLARVPPGQVIHLGLARGEAVAIKTGPPR